VPEAKQTGAPKSEGAEADGENPGKPIVIKKYANRRLYNTATSAYVTLDSLSDMVREGQDFLVQDARTGEDITRAVLTQIIFEQESRSAGGEHLLPVQFLRRLIRFYGHQMQAFVPSYLEMSMESFSKSQEGWRDQLSKAWSGKNPVTLFEDQARQNMALFDQALKMWAPFAPGAKPKTEPGGAPGEPDTLNEMKRQLEAMQRQLDQLSGTRKP
jgi:polyhydroxyalkanoate synthesis repressor PhaR